MSELGDKEPVLVSNWNLDWDEDHELMLSLLVLIRDSAVHLVRDVSKDVPEARLINLMASYECWSIKL